MVKSYSMIICLMAIWIVSFGDPLIANDQFHYLQVVDPSALAKSYPLNSKGNSINPFEGNNNLYQQIINEMGIEYERIGKREADTILDNNKISVTGGLNSIGFTYRRPFGDFSISADRSLAPDLFDEKRWIVNDTFSIFIDASKVLSNLKDQKLIDISEQNLAAFAGVVFKRTFTWVHFARTYQEGLTTHFEKLFMPFGILEFGHMTRLEPNEIIFKEDSLSIKGGGLVSSPLYTGVSGMAGVLAKFERLSRVEVVSLPSVSGLNDQIHLSYDKTKIASTTLSLGIQADFLKILRMTLLSYDFNYELSSSYKIYLNFSESELREMFPGHPVQMEISQLLKNRDADLDVLAPYVISEEKRITQTIKHKYNFLLLGGTKSSKTQQIEITTEGRVKNFYKHYFEKIKYTEDLVSRLFSSVLFAVLNTESSAAKMASESKKVAIEYESDRNLLENHEDLSIDKLDNQKLSMSFTAEFTTKKSKGGFGKKYRNRAIYYLERYSGVDPIVLPMVRSEHLVAPFVISGKYEVNTEGIRYLNSQSVGQVFDHLDGLCNEYPRNKIFNFRNLFDHCRRSLQNDYIDYFKDLSHDKVTAGLINHCESKAKKFFFSSSKKRAYLKNCIAKVSAKEKNDWNDIPLWSLKGFTNNIVINSHSKVHYYNLFGLQNVFFYGSFSALTADGRNFSTSFHEGEFKGLGVVDHYMRLENLRAPSSVVLDQ
ncbi:MAG: hypothetical protein KBD76_11325 [Bacteriovorax sp.]|nr:hypothetical protein [Bacteriovorax sp.]